MYTGTGSYIKRSEYLRLFDAETVHKLLPYEALIPALAKMHEGDIPSGKSVHLKDPSGADNMFVTLPGWLSDELIVVKMVGVFPENRERKPPLGSVLGAVSAFDAKTGAPILVADGEGLMIASDDSNWHQVIKA